MCGFSLRKVWRKPYDKERHTEGHVLIAGSTQTTRPQGTLVGAGELDASAQAPGAELGQAWIMWTEFPLLCVSGLEEGMAGKRLPLGAVLFYL